MESEGNGRKQTDPEGAFLDRLLKTNYSFKLKKQGTNGLYILISSRKENHFR